jgi:hypothetical protein
VGEGLHADAAAVQRHEGVKCLPLLSRGRLRRLRSLEREEKSDTFCTGSVFAQSPDEGGLLNFGPWGTSGDFKGTMIWGGHC